MKLSFAEEFKVAFSFYENGKPQIGNISLGFTVSTRASRVVSLFQFQNLATLP
jgi:hypothetical protein